VSGVRDLLRGSWAIEMRRLQLRQQVELCHDLVGDIVVRVPDWQTHVNQDVFRDLDLGRWTRWYGSSGAGKSS
jgi:hypothetical protein